MATHCSFIPQNYVGSMAMDPMFAASQPDSHPHHPPQASTMIFDTPFPQFSAFGGSAHPPQRMAHPQQTRIQQLNMQQAAYQQLTPQQTSPELSATTGSVSSSGKNTKTQTKAARRAEHNAIERARRESLNTKFQELAHALPNLQNDRRPSKGTIIERTLEYVRLSLNREQRYKNQMRALRHENRQLRKQLLGRDASPVNSVSDDDPNCPDVGRGLCNTPTPTMPNLDLSTPQQQSLLVNATHVATAQHQQQPEHWDLFTVNEQPVSTMLMATPPFDENSDDDCSTNGDELDSGHFAMMTNQFPTMNMMHPEYAALMKGNVPATLGLQSEYSYIPQHLLRQ